VCRENISAKPTPCRALDNIIESVHIQNQSQSARDE